MKKKQITISSQEDLNKHLQHSSPATWLILGVITSLLVAFFAWSFIYKIKFKIMANAHINSGVVTLNVDGNDINKLKTGQSIFIDNIEGKILSFDDEKKPVVSHFDLDDGEYTVTIIGEKRPIEFLLSK